MKTEEFWNKYINENILEIFNSTCDFFSNNLPNDFMENYDVGEVILETRGHQETAKEFDKVLKFTEILQDKQLELYIEYFQYFDEFLIDYYCFHGDRVKVEKAFSNFMNNPIHDYDKYLISFKKLLFFQYSELLEKAITKNFEIVNESDDLIGNAEYDLANCKFYLTLENLYKENNGIFDKDIFSKSLDKYNFEFDEDFLLSIEQGIFKPKLDTEYLKKAFIQDRKNNVIILEGYFLKYMYDKGFSFFLSGRIWDKMLNFWQKNSKNKNPKPDLYFKVQPDKFEKYLAEISGDMFIDNKSEMITVLWGSVYDLFKNIEIISQETFNSFFYVSRQLKGKVIGKFTPDLWNSNFVHNWEKPSCIAEAEFIEEEKIFRKSISFKHQKFTRLRSKISEELSKIGELSEFIIEGGKNDGSIPEETLIDDLFNSSHEFENGDENDIIEPIRIEQKVGRNEPCPCGSGKKYKKCCGKI